MKGRFRVRRVQDCDFRSDPNPVAHRPAECSEQAVSGVAPAGREDNFGASAGRVQHIPVGLCSRRAEGTQHPFERGNKGSPLRRIPALDGHENWFQGLAGVSAVDHPAVPGTKSRDCLRAP